MTGTAVVAGIAAAIAFLVYLPTGRRIEQSNGFAVIVAACFIWHFIAWAGLGCSKGFTHYFLALSIIAPIGFGHTLGKPALIVALLVQSILSCAISCGVYWLLRRNSPGNRQ